MTATVLRAKAGLLPLADQSVDLIVTSPPYFALRSYQDGGVHYAGQLGSEPTPAEFVAALLDVTRECVRVLKPSGSLWVNLGDKYASHAGGNPAPTLHSNGKRATLYERGSGAWKHETIRPKSLIGIPWRYALRCIDDLGLILRRDQIWSKPNGLPESVTDRCRSSHEYWFHFVLQSRYYSAVDEIREPYIEPAHPQRMTHPSFANRRSQDPLQSGWTGNPLGKLPGSVWTIPTQPLTVPAHLGIDHFAAFPMEWPRRLIRGWSPPGICTACGEGRRPAVERERAVGMEVSGGIWSRDGKHSNITGRQHSEHSLHTIIGYACACPDTTAPTRPSVVLDPFGGTGTTALVAHALGRHGISIDLSHDYSRLAQWRTTDEGEYARALQVDKPAVQVDGQGSLLDLIGGVS